MNGAGVSPSQAPVEAILQVDLYGTAALLEEVGKAIAEDGADVTISRCPARRPWTADEVANIAELLLSDAGTFITGFTFLADGGATASYYYGPLQPKE